MAQARRRRLGLALLLAPLAGPSAAWAAALLHALVTPRTASDPPSSIAAALVLLVAFCLFGVPLALVATIAVAWPLSLVLGRWVRSWWTLPLVCGAAGTALLPLYLKMLTPRGSWGFGPGIGCIAGAASGWVFWYLAIGAGGDATAHTPVVRKDASEADFGT